MTCERVVVVGASHAGAQLAGNLRREGWAGEVVLIGDEGKLPYHRPPMSKAYLAGKSCLDEILIRGAYFYAKQNIQLVDATVDSIDRNAGRVCLSTGDTVDYTKLALCIGARARRLPTPGAELLGIHYLRTAADVELIRAAAVPGRRVVIVGGGYIGLETAASLCSLGMQVTVLEATDRVLERVTAPVVSDFFTRIHRDAGVDIRTQAIVEAFTGNGMVQEVVLADGESLPADVVIVGVGVVPNTELASAAGLSVDNGIVIDDQARTSDPGIVAAGDCTSHVMARYGSRIRLESVASAGEQAKIAAATVCGKHSAIAALPWFWSDQYDLKLQIAGLNTGYDEVVLSGDPSRDREFSCFYFRGGELIAADSVNRPRDFMFSKRAITNCLPIDRAELLAAST
ncbi:FAD-dependent oxidoreductase [Candidatus Mycobacterium wuenschmannii]|uniref:FAD-dependent oxidoreductase n=1 Tax=Candidatus Mycobacterium wuenschmannii TaxID=3027808 RepID=A0ABY8VUR4_9MYCO|nr:FAD-dependent oxidoreductase [Candidatus Mycobacterium wuenschmannii]WIM85897.1 FAD-dependent oxidoreductase [Candidatus Mycobacterium wuenschmannii]